MGCAVVRISVGRCRKDGYEYGTSWKNIDWKTPEKVDVWSTRRPVEDANMREVATAGRWQGLVENLRDVHWT